MTSDRYWENISNKTKILFIVLFKKTESTFILDNDTTHEMNDSQKEKNVFTCENKHCTKNEVFH